MVDDDFLDQPTHDALFLLQEQLFFADLQTFQELAHLLANSIVMSFIKGGRLGGGEFCTGCPQPLVDGRGPRTETRSYTTT